MPEPRVIPGFYFDVEKGKYFKISTTHSAPPSQAKYTLQNIRKEQKKAAAEKIARKEQEKRESETIVRPHTRNKWGLQMASLDREIGDRRKTYYTHRIWPSARVARMEKMKTVVEQPVHGIIRFFDRDPLTKTIYAVHGDNAIRRRRQNPPSSLPIPGHHLDQDMEAVSLPDGMPFGSSFAESLNEYSFEPWDMLARLTSSISSLTYLPSSGALAATTYGSDRAPTVYLSDPDIDGPYVNQQFTPKNCSTIWGAAAPPFSSSPDSVPQSGTESLAVAAASSLMLFERSPAGDWNSSIALNRNSDVLALDWLSPTTVVLGERSGKILLYDTRSRGSSHILTNPFPITNLKRADDPTRLVCAGVQNSLFLYDIRSRDTFSRHAQGHYNDKFFNDQYPGSENRHKRKKMKFTVAANWSQPILSFPYDNIDDHYLDVAVQPDLGLVAAAQDANSSAAIKIYNMWTGKLLREIPQPSLVKVNIRCLRFMKDCNSDPELWSSWGGSIVKMSLG
ncbi:hypothetical protein P171DRAFT_415084 [Karstenula rhodostoma CBS 690.94]|uniref:WD40 repeat-like protein n=1 Tax=Karstenula rhodostoma CBS 690.94 TaxID=1392251 RepID=A0A9P4PHN6_9PLEO|nr:hypothetical protein P171DRAFT_415084 [Karstenula rhodostoma CBS 690.94]